MDPKAGAENDHGGPESAAVSGLQKSHRKSSRPQPDPGRNGKTLATNPLSDRARRTPPQAITSQSFRHSLRVPRCFRWNRFSLEALFGGPAWSEASRPGATAGRWPKTKRLIEKELRRRVAWRHTITTLLAQTSGGSRHAFIPLKTAKNQRLRFILLKLMALQLRELYHN